MTDLSLTIAPKSDQLNSDDLIGGPMTIHITKVSARPDSAEQPIAIYFEGDNEKPYMPCKSMRRVMVSVWGKDGTQYPGRSMTLYRDPKVTFGGLAVGGIRISNMSHIDSDITLALTATRANRKPFTVKPLVEAAAPNAAAAPRQPPPERTEAQWQAWLAKLRGSLAVLYRRSEVEDLAAKSTVGEAIATGPGWVRAEIDSMLAEAYARLQAPADDGSAANEPETEGVA